jgi:DNA mismatch repair ATPase MutL
MDSELIDRIYECSFVPELWPQVLREKPVEVINVVGYISPPNLNRSNRKEITLFVNGRWVQDIRLAIPNDGVSELRSVVPNASSILLRNWYGWFNPIERGLYQLTPEGIVALARWSPEALNP